MGWAVRVPKTLSSCPVKKCSVACPRRGTAPKQSRARPLGRRRDCVGGSGHGGGGGVSSRAILGGGDDDDPEGRGRHGVADWVRLVLCAGAPVLALHSLIPAIAMAAEPSAAQPLVDSLQQQDRAVRGNTEGLHTGATETSGASGRSGEVSAIKRLLREAFEDLISMKQQLQDLMPRSEDADIVTPHAGAMVRPSPKRLAADLRYKAKAQLSGALDFGCVLPWSDSPAADAREHTGEALAGAGLIAGGPPQVTALLQSAWGEHQQQSLTARLSSASGAAGSLWQAPPCHTTHLSCRNSGRGSSAGLKLDQLVFRQEVKPGLKVMVSALGGSLANLSRRLNPSADFGCTRAMRQGHDIPMVTEGGSGGAALMSSGPLSLSIGHFVSGGACQGLGHHSLAQLSVHSVQRSTASLVLSHVLAPHGPPPAPSGSCSNKQASGSGTGHDEVKGGGGLRYMGLLTPSCSSPSPIGAPSCSLAISSSCAHGGSHGSDCSNGSLAQGQLPWQPHLPSMPLSSHLRLGVAGSTTARDSMVLSAWHTILAAHNSGKYGTHSSSPQPKSPFKGSTSGIRISSVPDPQGRLLAAAVSTSASPMRLLESERTQETSSGGMHQQSGKDGPTLAAELSASIPVADGLSVCPGAVLVQEKGISSVGLVVQSTWRF